MLTRCHRAHAPLTGPHSHCPTRAGGRRCKPAVRPTSDAAATRRLCASIREVLYALSKASPSAVSLWRTRTPLQRRHQSATAWSRRNTVSTARSAAHRVRGERSTRRHCNTDGRIADWSGPSAAAEALRQPHLFDALPGENKRGKWCTNNICGNRAWGARLYERTRSDRNSTASDAIPLWQPSTPNNPDRSDPRVAA